MDDNSNHFCICFNMCINIEIILYNLLGRKTGKQSFDTNNKQSFAITSGDIINLHADDRENMGDGQQPCTNPFFVTKICHQHRSCINIFLLQKKIQKKLSRLESARSTRVEMDGIREEEEVFLQPKRVKFDKSTLNKKVKLDQS